MTDLRSFLIGRPLAWLAPAAVLTYGIGFLYWYADLGDRCGVAVQELAAVVFCVVGTALASPRLGSWEALGRPKVRWLAASSVLLILTIASILPVVLHLVVSRLPARAIPRASQYSLDGYGIDTTLPLVANVVMLGGSGLICVAVLGRRLGPLCALVAYPLFLWVDGSTDLPAPYAAACLDAAGEFTPKWGPAAVLALTGLVVWFRTGGAARSARYLDGVG